MTPERLAEIRARAQYATYDVPPRDLLQQPDACDDVRGADACDDVLELCNALREIVGDPTAGRRV